MAHSLQLEEDMGENVAFSWRYMQKMLKETPSNHDFDQVKAPILQVGGERGTKRIFSWRYMQKMLGEAPSTQMLC